MKSGERIEMLLSTVAAAMLVWLLLERACGCAAGQARIEPESWPKGGAQEVAVGQGIASPISIMSDTGVKFILFSALVVWLSHRREMRRLALLRSGRVLSWNGQSDAAKAAA